MQWSAVPATDPASIDAKRHVASLIYYPPDLGRAANASLTGDPITRQFQLGFVSMAVQAPFGIDASSRITRSCIDRDQHNAS